MLLEIYINFKKYEFVFLVNFKVIEIIKMR